MVTGGITSSDEPLPLVEVFPGGFFQDRDLSANYRFSCPSLPSSRYGHAQAGLEVCGGQDQDTSTNCQIELETKVHPKVRNHGEGPY